MFGRKHHQGRRSANPIYILFRLILSLMMFAVLLAGAYSAYKHFAGLDPLKLDPQVIVKDLLKARTPDQLSAVLSSLKLSPKINNIPSTNSAISFKFILVADSEGENINLGKAIQQAKGAGDLSFIIGLGDYTQVGTIDQLKAAKAELDSAGLRYFLVPGDHDLWDSRDKKNEAAFNFKQVFGPNFQSFNYQGYLFLLLDNSDNYLGFSKDQLDWVSTQLDKVTHPSEGGKTDSVKAIFVFIPSPLYHPSSDHYMGKTDSSLKQQAQAMILQLKQAGVKEVFAGDIHYFSEYEEPVTKLPMMTVGALATDRNPQSPRYAVVSVYDDGSARVDDTQIK